MYRQTIIDNDDYTADLEYAYGEVFLHCDIHNFSKSVYKRMLNDWLDMEEALREEGFTRVIALPIEEKGFISRTGWYKLTEVEGPGFKQEVWVWELD